MSLSFTRTTGYHQQMDGNINGGTSVASGTYVFSSQPRVVQRKKYRDKPVIRSTVYQNYSNFSNLFGRSDSFKARDASTMSNTLPLSAYSSFIENRKSKNQSANKYASANLHKFSPTDQKSFSRKSRTNFWDRRTPEPVEGRQHMEMQTELYLEEFGDMIEEVNQGCQTDPFINKPPTPMFVPAKIGIDASTQIFDGDLFDFDVEVRPMVEVLIGKVLEQSLMEVMEEEELASLRERQRMFEEMRNAELQEQQRLEEEDRRRKDEKLKRMKHQQELIRKEKETAEKIAAKAFAQSFLSDLVPSVVASLSENGYFHDPIEAELEKNFMEDLMRGVCKRLRYEVISRKLIDRIIKKIVRQREEQYLKSLEKKKQDSENDDESDDNSNDDDEFGVKRSRNKANSGREHDKVDGHIKKGHAVGGSYRY